MLVISAMPEDADVVLPSIPPAERSLHKQPTLSSGAALGDGFHRPRRIQLQRSFQVEIPPNERRPPVGRHLRKRSDSGTAGCRGRRTDATARTGSSSASPHLGNSVGHHVLRVQGEF